MQRLKVNSLRVQSSRAQGLGNLWFRGLAASGEKHDISYGLNSGWWGPIGDYIGFWGGNY